MTDLIAFITARLDEDESMARAATQAPWWHNPEKQWLGPAAFEAYDLSKGEEYVGYGDSGFSGCIAATGPASHRQSMADAAHIARHDPARVLREVEAKRQLLAQYTAVLGEVRAPKSAEHYANARARQFQLELALPLLALPYADHPQFLPEWATSE